MNEKQTYHKLFIKLNISESEVNKQGFQFDYLNQGFPTWGTCTPRDTFAYPKGYI